MAIEFREHMAIEDVDHSSWQILLQSFICSTKKCLQGILEDDASNEVFLQESTKCTRLRARPFSDYS